jgi:glycosyltransferase involved in cell wall biosynthesis
VRILINLSNINKGGGVQVALSFIGHLKSFTSEHSFYVVYSDALKIYIPELVLNQNKLYFYNYSIKPNVFKVVLGNDLFLNSVLIDNNCDKVFTLFGPSYWRPNVPHLVGYARPHYVYNDSPFFDGLNFYQKIALNIKKLFHLCDFKFNSSILVTENINVSNRIAQKLKKKVYTVSNTYHQIFEDSTRWRTSPIEFEEGFVHILTISANYPHKNLNIIPKVIEELLRRHIYNFRFYLSVNKGEIDSNEIANKYINYLGQISIAECPDLYHKSTIVLLPSLLECFSASYAESMKMNRPIITSNLPFATGICLDAAIYVDPLNPIDIVDKLLEVLNNKEKRDLILAAGSRRLQYFGDSKLRARKYLELLEAM